MRVTAWWMACMMVGVACANDIPAPGSRIKSQWLKSWVLQAEPDKQASGYSYPENRSVSKEKAIGIETGRDDANRPSCQVRELGEPCPRGGVATMGSPFPLKDPGVGNPINIRNGNKYQRETDLPDSNLFPGLELVRHYNSMDPRQQALGAGWRWSYESRLYQVSSGEVQVIQADGSRLRFVVRDRPDVFQSQLPRRGNIQRLKSGQWRWSWPTASALTFDKDGMLISVLHPKQGVHVSIRWEDIGKRGTPVIREVAVLSGGPGKLLFEYRTDLAAPQLKQVTTPSGVFEYAFDDHTPNPRLAWVFRPDGMKKQYHHEPERQSGHDYAITGISVWSANGQVHERRQAWSYDSSGRAKTFDGEVVGGVRDQVRLTYLSPSEARPSTPVAFKDGEKQDVSGRLRGRSFGAGRSWQWKYDLHGRVISMRAQHHQQSTETRIAWQSLRPVVIAHPEEKEIRRYDRRGQLRERTVVRPTKHGYHSWIFRERFRLNQDGRRIRHELPEGGALRYEWETDGRLMKLEWISKDGRHHDVISAMPAGYRYGNGLYAVGRQGARGLMDWMVYQPLMRTTLFRQQILLNAAGRVEQE